MSGCYSFADKRSDIPVKLNQFGIYGSKRFVPSLIDDFFDLEKRDFQFFFHSDNSIVRKFAFWPVFAPENGNYFPSTPYRNATSTACAVFDNSAK